MCPRVGTAYTCPIPNVDKYWEYNTLDKDSGIEISINRYQFEKLPYNITFNEPATCIAVHEDFNDIYEVEDGDTLIHLKGQWETSSLSHASSTLYFISDSVLVSNLKDLTDDQRNEANIILSGDQVKRAYQFVDSGHITTKHLNSACGIKISFTVMFAKKPSSVSLLP